MVYWNIALTINGSVREKQFESKDNSWQDILYHSGSVCLSACCYFIIEFFDNKHQEKYCRSIIPDREYQTDEDNRRFVFSAQKIKDGGDCLRFYTAHMEVSVYADDTLIYHVGQQQAMPKVSPGVMWNYVGIPSGAEQIQL